MTGDSLQGPHPTIDGWVLPTSAVKLMDAGGFNANSVLIGGNSYDGTSLSVFYPQIPLSF